MFAMHLTGLFRDPNKYILLYLDEKSDSRETNDWQYYVLGSKYLLAVLRAGE